MQAETFRRLLEWYGIEKVAATLWLWQNSILSPSNALNRLMPSPEIESEAIANEKLSTINRSLRELLELPPSSADDLRSGTSASRSPETP